MDEYEGFPALKEKVLEHNPQADVEKLERAYELAAGAHKDQKRKSGEPFVIHPVAVSAMLAEMDMDLSTVIAGMLHDTVEDTDVTLEQLEEQFGIMMEPDDIVDLSSFEKGKEILAENYDITF